MKTEKRLIYIIIASITTCVFLIMYISNILSSQQHLSKSSEKQSSISIIIDGNKDSIGALVTINGTKPPGFHTSETLIDSRGFSYRFWNVTLSYGSYTTIITKTGYKAATTGFTIEDKPQVMSVGMDVYLAPVNSKDSSYASANVSVSD